MTKLRQRLYQKDNYVQLSNSLKKSLTFSELYGIFYVRMINYYSNIKIIIVGIIFIISYFFIAYPDASANIDVRYLGSIDKKYSIIKPSIEEKSTQTKPLEVSPPQHIETKYVTTRKEETNIKVTYAGITSKETYPAEERGPAVITILDPYHPKHKGMSIPYYKDREGLKIHPWVGIRGEYMDDEELVPIQSLIMEAKEYNQTTDSQLRDYISTNDKHYLRGEVILHYKESWPKFTYIYHAERVRRKYEAKKIWSTNDIYYDNNDKKYCKLEYTIPGLPYIGYLKLTGRYGNNRHYEPNNNAGYKKYDSWQFILQTMPFFDTELKTELLYHDGTQPRYATVEDWEKYELYVELKKLFPRHYLTITPHYKWKDEEFFPVTNNDEWIEHKVGVKIEKEINGNLEFNTDWTYIDYARDKQRDTSSYKHISLKALNIENEIKYEIIRDLKIALGLDYATGFSEFDGFDNYTIKSELSYRKPGLADYRIGLRHTDYYNINDSVDTVYFKIGLFI